MNPILNPLTVGFALAAIIGIAVGLLWGRRFFVSYAKGLTYALPGLLAVYLCGLPLAVVLAVWTALSSGDSFWDVVRPLRELILFAATITFVGMLTGAPGFLYGYARGALWNRMKQDDRDAV